MTAHLLRADALTLPLADSTVDLIVTSPPYFALRSYTDNGEHYTGQLGSEPTPAAYVDALIAATREMVRVLKPSGSIWLNLGDKYSQRVAMRPSSHQDGLFPDRDGLDKDWQRDKAPYQNVTDRDTGRYVPEKSLMGIPWRYALRCIDDLRLILRAEVIWSKPNGLPESVTDRVRRSHEQWFHFTKEPRYYSAVDEIREPHLMPENNKRGPRSDRGETALGMMAQHSRAGLHSLGKLPSSVWSIAEGESLVRSVLGAVSHGALTVDEGERILSWTYSGSGTTPASETGAGNGTDSSTPTATPDTTRSHSPQAEHTGSPTRSQSDPSPTGSPSTTCAETGDASDPTTSRPSPSKSTSTADPGQTSASTVTSSPMRTLTSAQEAAESAAHVCGTGCGSHGHAEGPPSTWVIATQPLTVPASLGVDHFAAFPMDWPRRLILGWSPSGVCTACGEGRRPVARSLREPNLAKGLARQVQSNAISGGFLRSSLSDVRGTPSAVITGYACACTPYTDHPGSGGPGWQTDEHRIGATGKQHVAANYPPRAPRREYHDWTPAPTRPAVVLDPFGGTGTTALVADALGRTGISVDMSADYCRLARWRTTDPAQRAAALQVEKPAPVIAGQGDLFDERDEGIA